MNNEELADRVVALGVGEVSRKRLPIIQYRFHEYFSAYKFVREWRVAGALMEKCWSVEIDKRGCPWWVAAERPKKPQKFRKAKNESLPRAIIEACVEALDSVQTGLNQ